MTEKNKDYVMPWGKYKGETLEQIYIDNRGYLDWLLEKRAKDPGLPEGEDPIVVKIRGTEKEMRRTRVY